MALIFRMVLVIFTRNGGARVMRLLLYKLLRAFFPLLSLSISPLFSFLFLNALRLFISRPATPVVFFVSPVPKSIAAGACACTVRKEWKHGVCVCANSKRERASLFSLVSFSYKWVAIFPCRSFLPLSSSARATPPMKNEASGASIFSSKSLNLILRQNELEEEMIKA